jgi:hypothetical protein
VLTGDSVCDLEERSGGGWLLFALWCVNGSFLPPLLGLPLAPAEVFVFEELAFTPSLELELELLE